MILLKGASCVRALMGCALMAAFLTPCAMAQNTGSESKPPEARSVPEATETIYLNNASGPNDLNDIQTALRNSFVHARMYGVPGQYAITVRGTAEDVQAAKKLVAELDRPRKVYRVTYTVTESDGGKRTGEQHFSLLIVAGSKTTLRQGNRVPLVTGINAESAHPAQTAQVQYVDIGLNIDASIEGVGLKTKIERSAVAEEKSEIGLQDPVIRQTMLEGFSTLQGGKPVTLGSLDLPGTTRHQEIEVTTELLTK